MSGLNRKISVLGCGWYGFELARILVSHQYTVKGSTTTPEKLEILQKAGITPYLMNFQENEEDTTISFFDCSVLIISIPPKRSTAEQHTYLSKIKRIAKNASLHKVPEVIFISSTSVYEDCNGKVDEYTIPNPDTDSGKAMLTAELHLRENSDFNSTIIRFGGLIGPGRNPGRFFAGKTAIPNGKAPVNLIHLTDCIGITLQIIEKSAFGYLYNACAEDHPERQTFYTAAALNSGLERPEFINELKNWKQVNSINIKEKLNYNFQVTLNSPGSQ